MGYLQVQMVQTNGHAVSVDTQSTGFTLGAVQFNMAKHVWDLILQFEDHQVETRRVLLLFKTREIEGLAVYTSRQDRVCETDAMNRGLLITDATGISQCIQGITNTFHILLSFV